SVSASGVYQKARVVSAERHETSSTLHLKKTDAPTSPTEHDYDVATPMNCSVYVSRYRSGINFLPASLRPCIGLEAMVEKLVMDVKLRDSEEARFSIIKS